MLLHLRSQKFMILNIVSFGALQQWVDVLPDSSLPILELCILDGISSCELACMNFLNDKPEIVALAQRHQVTITDVHETKASKDLHFWTGDIFKLKTPVVAVIGMDCAMGKRKYNLQNDPRSRQSKMGLKQK
jgi:uncharacterized NAD-dependent epimerase/dehydratase family protein